MATPDFDALLTAAIAGDQNAAEQLVEPHRLEVRQLLRAYLSGDKHSLQDAEDLEEETLVRAYAGLRTFRGVYGVRSFRAWVLRIATNLLSNYIRRDRPRHRQSQSLEDLTDNELYQVQRIEAPLCPEQVQEAPYVSDVLTDAVRTACTLNEMRVLWMQWQGGEPDEIAGFLDNFLEMNPNTVRSYLHRGRIKVWAYLVEHHADLLGSILSIRKAADRLRAADNPADRLTEQEEQLLARIHPSVARTPDLEAQPQPVNRAELLRSLHKKLRKYIACLALAVISFMLGGRIHGS